MIEEYIKARKNAEKEYKERTAKGEYPFLPALDDIQPDCGRLSQRYLGLIEIPVDLIAGTKTRARQNSFAPNFMPLLDADTEFAAKWASLYRAQLADGFNDPVKVCEYMHRFYVTEGNKRVSVSRFLDMPVICAEVTRIMPPVSKLERDPVYSEFLSFYDVTGLYDIELTRDGAYASLAELLGLDLENRWPEETVSALKSSYWRFTDAYGKLSGRAFELPEGDAFIVYLGIYAGDALEPCSAKVISRRIEDIEKELLTEGSHEKVALVEEADEALNAGSLITKTVSRTGNVAGMVIPALSYSPRHPLRAAFIYDKTVKGSSWTADHEKGRLRLERAYNGTVETMAYENCGDTESFERAVADAHSRGADVVFTTTPAQIRDTLRAAIQYKDIRFLNCSVNLAHHAVRTYYAKIYEAKFLAGIIAGIYSAADGTHRIGYCSDYPIYGTVAGINAFAIGAAMTDPNVKIYLDWTSRAESNWWWETLDSGIHVMSAVDSLHNSDGSDAFGLCYVERCEPGTGNDLSGSCRIKNLAAPIWKWGKLYEIIIKTILDGSYGSRAVDKKDRATNYWWGMISGAVDIELSDELSPYTKQLVRTLRADIINGSFNPFDGELVSQDGVIKRAQDGYLSSRDIITMDWLNENIIGEIPVIDSLKDEARTTVKVSGVGRTRSRQTGDQH